MTFENHTAYTARSNPAPGTVSQTNTQKWLIVSESWPSDQPRPVLVPLWDEPAVAGQPSLGFNDAGEQIATQAHGEALAAFRDRVRRATNGTGSIRYYGHISELPGYLHPSHPLAASRP